MKPLLFNKWGKLIFFGVWGALSIPFIPNLITGLQHLNSTTPMVLEVAKLMIRISIAGMTTSFIVASASLWAYSKTIKIKQNQEKEEES